MSELWMSKPHHCVDSLRQPVFTEYIYELQSLCNSSPLMSLHYFIVYITTSRGRISYTHSRSKKYYLDYKFVTELIFYLWTSGVKRTIRVSDGQKLRLNHVYRGLDSGSVHFTSHGPESLRVSFRKKTRLLGEPIC